MDDMPLDNITSNVIQDVMNDETDITRLLADAGEKISREAYARGWRDAVAALQKAAAELAESPVANNSDSIGPIDLSISKGAVPNNLTVGSTPYYTYQAIKKRPGMTGSEIVAAVQEAGHNVSEGNIRTSIARVKDKKLIVARHNKWFAV